MLKKYFVGSLMLLAISLCLGTAVLAIAPGPGPNLGLEYAAETGLSGQDLRLTVAYVINISLGLLGIICTVLIVYAGFKYMTAGGNEENTKEALKIIYAAVIGLLIILSAFIITRFITTSLFKATTNQDYGTVQDYNGPY